MSRCHVAPHVIETEIELFLDNFKYVTSLLQNEFSVLDCRSSLQSSYHPVLLSPNDNNRLSWPDDTESVSGPRHSVTTESDANRNSVTSSSLWSTDVTSFEFDADPSPPSSQKTELGNVVRSDTELFVGGVPMNTAAETECVGCSSSLTVVDVFNALQASYAFISGGKTECFCHVLTFPDCPSASSITESEYRDVVKYLVSVPPLHESDVGFVIVVDRRQDKWGSVKTLLLRISGYFPALLHKVFVLRPSSFLQKAFADVGLKFLDEDFRTKILLLNNVQELHEHIDRTQLTPDLGGSLQFDHQQWIQHRVALEKFSGTASEVAARLRQLCGRLEDTQFPNDVTQTEQLIAEHDAARHNLKRDLETVIDEGENLLVCFKTITVQHHHHDNDVVMATQLLPASRVTQVMAVERLLLQLDETAGNFDAFWKSHRHRLERCLQLRQFEEQFKQLQVITDEHLRHLVAMETDEPDSAADVDEKLAALDRFHRLSAADMQRAEQLRISGQALIGCGQYAVDCVQPKCAELDRICTEFTSHFNSRRRRLHEAQLIWRTVQRTTCCHDDKSRDVTTTARDKETCVVEEIISTEKTYVDELCSIVEGYENQLDRDEMKPLVTESLRAGKYALFANLQDIYDFHSQWLLEELRCYSESPPQIAQCFLEHRDRFERLYSEYCQNMNESQLFLQQLGDDDDFLQECQRRLQHRLPLRAYLLKPVQRITKYKLLLKELLQYCSSDQTVSHDVTMALSSMTSVVRHINDVMHHSTITAFPGDAKQLGSLLLQASFSVWLQNGYNRMRFKLSPTCRHLFLYEQAIMFCKLKPQLNSTAAYVFKTLIKTSDICLTEDVKGDSRKFELWTSDRSQAYILQADTTEVKDEWISQLSELIQRQTTRLHASRSYDEYESSLSASSTTESVRCCESDQQTICIASDSEPPGASMTLGSG